MMQELIQQTRDGLKDFQRKTVDFVLSRLDKGQRRMLIADEVGLGKTIVAKGIIAGMFEKHLKKDAGRPFNVVYVCSNQAIAQANIRKLNFTGDSAVVITSADDDRISALAYSDRESKSKHKFTLRAFTPATSFDDGTSIGRADERVLLYQLLCDYEAIWPYTNSLKWILKGRNNMLDDTWENKIHEIDAGRGRPFYNSVKVEFRKRMEENADLKVYGKCYAALGSNIPVKLWTLVKNLAQLELRKNNYRYYDFSHELVAKLRILVAQSCVHLLKADLFILDEFQRYKNLIEPVEENTSAATEMTNAIFQQEDVRILLLSATPFKAYTSDFEQVNGEIHHKEFKTVLKFLSSDRKAADWNEFERHRNLLFDFMRRSDPSPEKADEALQAKQSLEGFYRDCMVRTERISVAENKDALIIDKLKDNALMPTEAEIRSFLQADEIADYLNKKHDHHLPVPIEYAKSAPYILSFLEGYQQRTAILDAVAEDDQLQAMLRKNTEAWFNIKKVQDYKPLDSKEIPSGRLRVLIEQTLSGQKSLLLWVPPTLPYFTPSGPFKDEQEYSKTLVFSSWRLVPRMIATLVSYEAERLTVGNQESISVKEKASDPDGDGRFYFDKKRNPRPKILFQMEKAQNRPRQMEHILYLYPSSFLSSLYDPQTNLTEQQTVEAIQSRLTTKIVEALQSAAVKAVCGPAGNTDWRIWFWAGAPLLDKIYSETESLTEWFQAGFPKLEIATDSEDESEQRYEKGAKQKFFDRLREAYQTPQALQLPRLTREQEQEVASYLALLAMASPAVCYLRTQRRYFSERSSELLNAAFEVGLAFITYFNKPESISVVRLSVPDSGKLSYLDKVLEYSVSGNLQAVLDEYAYLIRDLEGLRSPKDIAEHISDVLTVRTTPYKIDTAESLIAESKDYEGEAKMRNRIRTHFAVDFGGQRLHTAKTQGHQINIRQAFNSPFAPFVLATTSVGQEGLDFHLYCRRIFHWNLPANAIDIEQREGRINRYKGHVIRQILAEKYASNLNPSAEDNAWELLFDTAQSKEGKGIGKSELIPYWHSESAGQTRLERFVPLYAYSKEIEKYKELLRVLTFYRLTFGQPRQEELITALSGSNASQNHESLQKLMLNLSPMDFD